MKAALLSGLTVWMFLAIVLEAGLWLLVSDWLRRYDSRVCHFPGPTRAAPGQVDWG